jgi:hypothetical protein
MLKVAHDKKRFPYNVDLQHIRDVRIYYGPGPSCIVIIDDGFSIKSITTVNLNLKDPEEAGKSVSDWIYRQTGGRPQIQDTIQSVLTDIAQLSPAWTKILNLNTDEPTILAVRMFPALEPGQDAAWMFDIYYLLKATATQQLAYISFEPKQIKYPLLEVAEWVRNLPGYDNELKDRIFKIFAKFYFDLLIVKPEAEKS